LNFVRITKSPLQIGDVLQMGSLHGTRLIVELQERELTTANLSKSTVGDLLSSLSKLRLSAKEVFPAAQEMETLNWLVRAARQLNEGCAVDEIIKAFLHLALQLTGLERGFVFCSKTKKFGSPRD
jgi:sigma-B regulation protein RsbU (phosphoserine phosphatase)